MPKALTEQERLRQCKRLLEKGKAVVLAQGIKKVSVDDIAGAAGIAKGSFYQYFESKEKFLFALIWDIHRQMFAQAEKMIREENDLQGGLRDFMVKVFNMPEMRFFLKHSHHDLLNAYAGAAPDNAENTFKQMEEEGYGRLLTLAGIDTSKARPGVVHNYFHALYLAQSSELMNEEDLPETFQVMVDGLINYIFGGIA